MHLFNSFVIVCGCLIEGAQLNSITSKDRWSCIDSECNFDGFGCYSVVTALHLHENSLLLILTEGENEFFRRFMPFYYRWWRWWLAMTIKVIWIFTWSTSIVSFCCRENMNKKKQFTIRDEIQLIRFTCVDCSLGRRLIFICRMTRKRVDDNRTDESKKKKFNGTNC